MLVGNCLFILGDQRRVFGQYFNFILWFNNHVCHNLSSIESILLPNEELIVMRRKYIYTLNLHLYDNND